MAVRAGGAAWRGRSGTVQQRWRGADPHADRHRDAACARLWREGDARLRDGGRVHRRHVELALGRFQPRQYRFGRFLPYRFRRLRPDNGSGRSGRDRRDACRADALLSQGHSAALRCRSIAGAGGCDSRPCYFSCRLGGAGIAADRLLRARSDGRAGERRGGTRRGDPDPLRRSRTSHPRAHGDSRGALADRDLLARDVSRRVRASERRVDG